MKTFVRYTLLSLVSLLALLSPAYAQVSIGIKIFAPPPPRVAVVTSVAPSPDHVWIEGYWYPVGNHYKWHEGYWTRPPYEGARWVAPRHDGERYFAGYWDGDRGRVEHDHHSDHEHDRDFHGHGRDDRHDSDRDDHHHGRDDH